MKNCRYAHSEVLLWTLAGIIVSCSCFHSSSENRDYWELNFDQLFGNSKRQIEDGFVNSMVKLVHFFIARCLQFRYLPALQHGSSMYMLFWVAFTLSISSLSVDL